MTWEIVAGILSLLAAFISVATVAVRVNRAIVLLQAAVKRLDSYIDLQQTHNEKTETTIHGLDHRVLKLETEHKNNHNVKGVFNEHQIEADFAKILADPYQYGSRRCRTIRR